MYEEQVSQSPEREPQIQLLRSIRIQTNRYYAPQSVSESRNIDSDDSVDDGEYQQKLLFQSYSIITTKNSIQSKGRSLQRLRSSETFKSRLASIQKIKAYKYDETHSEDEEESLPKDLMNVDFQFRQDAIICVQKILQQKK